MTLKKIMLNNRESTQSLEKLREERDKERRVEERDDEEDNADC